MANDTDIFGAPSGVVSDSDIFKDLPAPKIAALTASPTVSEKLPSTFSDRMKASGLAAVKGLVMGGPGGMVQSAGAEALKQSGEALDHAAYGAGETVSDAASKVLPPEAAAGLGYAANVATQAVPAILGGGIAKTAASPAFEAGAKLLMQSALKPTIEQLRSGKAARAIDTLLEEGINPTKGGVDVLKTKIGDLGAEIKDVIANSAETVNKGEVGKRLLETYEKFKNQVNPEADLEAIKKAWIGFRDHPLLAGLQEIPVQLAQKLKQGTYKALGEKPYGELQGATTEAQKTLARGLKEEISKAVPEVAPLNARESNLLNALNVSERRALMDMNKNPMGIALLAHNPSTFAAFMADKSALFKSMVARMLYSGSEAIPQAAGSAGAGALQVQNGQPALSPQQGALYR